MEQIREHFEGITRDRYEELPRAIVDVFSQVRDLRDDEESRKVSREIDGEPSALEIRRAMKEMRDSAPGEDEVKLDYIRKGGAEIIDRVVRIVQEMWSTPAEQWEGEMKVGIMVPLHKKGDKGEVNNFRGVCLLAMGSRILARIAAKRLGVWAESMGILDDNQAGFRRGRSTADVVQVMVRLEEDVEDLRRRVLGGSRDLD